MPSVMPGMRNSHRLFLQSFMSRHILGARDVKELYRKCCEKFQEEPLDDQLANFVVLINQNIKPVHMEIKKGVSEDTGTNFYVLVNTQDSSITKCSPDFTKNELELFKKIVEKIVDCEDGEIRSMDAINLNDELERKMSKRDAQELIIKLQTDKWLRNHQGFISLDTRAVIELEQYLKEQYPEQVVSCNMCKKICLKGQSCSQCDVKLHYHCAARLFRDQNAPKCPGRGCCVVWPHKVQSNDMPSSQIPASQPSTSQSRKRRR